MKEKIKKNKNKLIVALTITFSLSGAVAFAQVASPEQQLTSNNQTQVLGASLSETEETEKNEEAEDSPEAILAAEETALLAKQKEKEDEYREILAQIDYKVVPNKYKDFNFANIGTLSAKDVQIGISTASEFVNIRESADAESEILGKLYKDEAAAVLSIEDGWAQVESGSVKGYVTTDYLNLDLTKDQVIDNFGKVRATSTVAALNVRQEANTESTVLTSVNLDEKNTLLEELGDWVKISVAKDGVEGYVSSEYVNLSVSFEEAISIEEEQEIIRQKQEAERKAAEEAAKKKAAEEAAKQKAAEETAKKKAAEEAAKKKTAEQAATKKTASKPAATTAPVSVSTNEAKEIIASRESGGNYNAVSKSGTYIGRYQLHKSYLGGDHSPENQERVVENYVANRYGTWQKALSFWNANGWY